MANKQTYIAVAVALVVVLVFFMLGIFGVGGFRGDTIPDNLSSTEPNGPQAILDELSQTGTVAGLRTAPIAEGAGPEAEAGDTITVHYIGVLPDGTLFDTSRQSGVPFTFTLGVGQVIDGWDQALLGSKVGDRLIIAIPPELGYGAEANGPIPANSTLLFDVEVLAVEKQ